MQSADSSRSTLARAVAARIDGLSSALSEQWRNARPIAHFVVDDLLPDATARAIYAALPDIGGLLHRASLRERKKAGVDLEAYEELVSDALLCFQEDEVLAAIGRVIGSDSLHGDPTLYASGVSAMEQGDFVNPHIDNSHDGDQQLYRVLNLLYYTTPNWSVDNGGNLELWDPGVKNPHAVPAAFNRLVVMVTNQDSWHSVNPVRVPRARWCVSNYYFARRPLRESDYRHVTTFTGRPEEPLKRLVLGLDARLLNAVGKRFPFLTRLTRHRRRPVG